MISCKDVSRILASDAVEFLGWRRRLELRLHLLMCKLCSQLAREIGQMRDAAREASQAHEPDGALEARILRKLPGPPQP